MPSVPGKVKYRKAGRCANMIETEKSFQLLEWFEKDFSYLSLLQGFCYCWYLVCLYNLFSQIIYIIQIEVRSPISSGWMNGEKGSVMPIKWFSSAYKLSTTSNIGDIFFFPKTKRKIGNYYFNMNWDNRLFMLPFHILPSILDFIRL